MATHGTCETEGPGPCRYPPVRIKDITAGLQARQRRLYREATDHVKPALPDRPAIMAARTGRHLNHTSYRLGGAGVLEGLH
jgi:hypothetical protein